MSESIITTELMLLWQMHKFFKGAVHLSGNEAISLFEKFRRRLTVDISASWVAIFAWVRDTSVSQ